MTGGRWVYPNIRWVQDQSYMYFLVQRSPAFICPSFLHHDKSATPVLMEEVTRSLQNPAMNILERHKRAFLHSEQRISSFFATGRSFCQPAYNQPKSKRYPFILKPSRKRS